MCCNSEQVTRVDTARLNHAFGLKCYRPTLCNVRWKQGSTMHFGSSAGHAAGNTNRPWSEHAFGAFRLKCYKLSATLYSPSLCNCLIIVLLSLQPLGWAILFQACPIRERMHCQILHVVVWKKPADLWTGREHTFNT